MATSQTHIRQVALLIESLFVRVVDGVVIDKIKSFQKWEKPLSIPDVDAPLNLLARAAVGKGFGTVGARRGGHFDDFMRFGKVQSVFSESY